MVEIEELEQRLKHIEGLMAIQTKISGVATENQNRISELLKKHLEFHLKDDVLSEDSE